MIISRATYINDPPADELYLRAGPDSPGGRQRNRPLPSGLPTKYVRSVKPVPNHAGKDIPRTLYFLQGFQCRTDITDRFFLAQLAVQVRQGSRSPRFDTAVPGNEQRGKHTVTYFLSGRNRWRDERYCRLRSGLVIRACWVATISSALSGIWIARSYDKLI